MCPFVSFITLNTKSTIFLSFAGYDDVIISYFHFLILVLSHIGAFILILCAGLTFSQLIIVCDDPIAISSNSWSIYFDAMHYC